MTDKQLKQAISQLPQSEKFSGVYRATEGDIRLVGKTADEREFRYQIIFDKNEYKEVINVSIKPF